MSFINSYFGSLWLFSGGDIVPTPNVQLTEDAFPAFLEVDISKGVNEIPTFLMPYYTDSIALGYKKILFNLANGGDENEIRTFRHKTISTILRKFYGATTNSIRIAHIITSKGIHYYGCKGLILDANRNPLLVSTVKCEYDATNRVLKVTNPVCRVSYRVFTNSSELVEKTIIKQGIPYYSQNTVNYGLNRTRNHEYVEVVIDDYDYMIIKPSKPSFQSIVPDNINKIILDNYDNF